MNAISCTVTGRVQGVAFRYWTRERAALLGLSGWVQNLPDGSVRTFAQGGETALQQFQTELWDGPPLAHVAGLVCEPAEPDQTLTAFLILR